MSAHKGPHPGEEGMEPVSRERGGRFNMKVIAGGAAGILFLGAGVYAIAGITQQVDREDPKGLQPASFTAKAPDVEVKEPATAAVETKKADPGKTEPATETKKTEERVRDRGQERKAAPNPNFKVKTVMFDNAHMASVINPYLSGSASGQGIRQEGGGGGMGQRGEGMAEGTGGGSGRRIAGNGGESGSGNAKGDFYTGGGGRSGQGLYHPHSLQPELAGCVVKAGEEIIVESPNPVRTELPGQVRGRVVEDVWGWEFLGGGRQQDCLAIPAGSTTMAEVNAAAVGRGSMRVQMCATRIDLLGGGIMPMECSPTLGQDGAAGVEAESDYQWGGIATGILIEAALSAAGALGGLIEGPAGVAVNVGTQGLRGVGSEYVNRELMRPPVLTMQRGAIYRIQVNADISFPLTGE